MKQLFIPKQIKVGYNERRDTYSGKLAYVIYKDAKGKLRKEKSWRGWIQEKMGIDDFDNVPTNGFVINKGAGGYGSGWNHRAAKVRVFDPRGFEIEIDIPNLLHILQETQCDPGKGLTGEFVYSWEGSELRLLPTSCKEYKEANEFTTLQDQKISAKDLVIGATYLTKSEDTVIYLGKHNWSPDHGCNNYGAVVKPAHVFYGPNRSKYDGKFFSPAISTLGSVINDQCTPDYADIMDKFETYSKKNLDKIFKEFTEKPHHATFETMCRSGYGQKKENFLFVKIGDKHYRQYRAEEACRRPWSVDDNEPYHDKVQFHAIKDVKVVPGGFTAKPCRNAVKDEDTLAYKKMKQKYYNEEEIRVNKYYDRFDINNLNFLTLSAEFEDGSVELLSKLGKDSY